MKQKPHNDYLTPSHTEGVLVQRMLQPVGDFSPFPPLSLIDMPGNEKDLITVSYDLNVGR